MYACIPVCIHIYRYQTMCTRGRVFCFFLYMHIYTHTYYVYAFVCIPIRSMHAHKQTHTRAHIYIYTHKYEIMNKYTGGVGLKVCVHAATKLLQACICVCTCEHTHSNMCAHGFMTKYTFTHKYK